MMSMTSTSSGTYNFWELGVRNMSQIFDLFFFLLKLLILVWIKAIKLRDSNHCLRTFVKELKRARAWLPNFEEPERKGFPKGINSPFLLTDRVVYVWLIDPKIFGIPCEFPSQSNPSTAQNKVTIRNLLF